MRAKIDKLFEDKIICFDGAMGTLLQKQGLPAHEIPEAFNFTNPDVIQGIHEAYIQAGADVITTNSFGVSKLAFIDFKYTLEDTVRQAVCIARASSKQNLVALDIGPTGKLMEPMGELSFEHAYDIFKTQVTAGTDAGADLILIETMSDVYEAKAAILAAKENSPLPVLCTMTFEENRRTLTGSDPLTVVTILESLGVDGIGINCSLGPKDILSIIEEMLEFAEVPVMVQPNAGLPKLIDGKTVFDVTSEEFAETTSIMAERGVRIVGGCCGTTPEFIRALKNAVKEMLPQKCQNRHITAVTSRSKTVILDEDIKIIGERINPTGKKRFKEALLFEDYDYILDEAINQKEAGADILDVNVGLPEIDEKAVMIKVVKEIQQVTALPLQIDSANPEVIEAAVRIYNGKPLINSVNGKKEIMDKVFPIVKKYGACVIGLTLDEKGIPAAAEERLEIAKRIVDTAVSYGIAKENIIIDCLVLTASVQQKEVMETIKAVNLVKKVLGVKTTLGISNVSFGLPERALLNKTYLAMALTMGLDVPILNPLVKDMVDTVKSFRVLANFDHEAKDYVKHYGGKEVKSEVRQQRDLKEIISHGLKDEAALAVKDLLKKEAPLAIIDTYLVPALDVVGKKFEKGDLFLPQLLQAAETAKKAFEILKEEMIHAGAEEAKKGTIVLATVKGDVHDLGKNIVKILLETYGYEIFDLGKDVPVSEVVNVVLDKRVKLVGLSALMTTTVSSMEETIRELRREAPDCLVMVGGAVLTEDSARKIGADYYAKDAMGSVEIARKVFEK